MPGGRLAIGAPIDGASDRTRPRPPVEAYKRVDLAGVNGEARPHAQQCLVVLEPVHGLVESQARRAHGPGVIDVRVDRAEVVHHDLADVALSGLEVVVHLVEHLVSIQVQVARDVHLAERDGCLCSGDRSGHRGECVAEDDVVVVEHVEEVVGRLGVVDLECSVQEGGADVGPLRVGNRDQP